MQTNQWKRDDPRFDSYIQVLKKHGLQINPTLKPAIFTLSNGLEYPGLRVQDNVIGPNNLVTIPTTLLLTSHKARQQPALSTIFTHQFYNSGEVWQDRILITYLLYIFHQKDLTNIWYHMVEVFSKQVDIVSFWNIEEIENFCDKSIHRAAMLERKNFERQWREFQTVKEQNQQFFSEFCQQAFGKQNYKWIYTHAVSRCFGSFMNSTYFTPFCQFFNHHCVDVSYQCVTQQEHVSHVKKNEELKQLSKGCKQLQKSQQQEKEEENDDSSSVSSGNSSVDYIEDGDFNYWQVESYKIKWGGKVSFDLKDKQTAQVQKLHKQCLQLILKSLTWNGFNFVFIGQVIEKLNIIKNEYMAGRKKFQNTKQSLEHTRTVIQNYRQQALAFYRMMGFKYNPKTQNQQTIDNLPSSSLQKKHLSTSVYQKTSNPPTKDYKYFIMETDSKAQFYKNDQIYFCYGHISNRTMLIRYGCCVQDNIYEHVWFKLPLNKVFSPYPDLFQEVQEKGLPIYYKLKIKATVWPFELYLWFKLLKWELVRHSVLQIFYPYDIDQEIDIFQSISLIIKGKIPQFTAYENYENLTDPSISYHEYFMRVYHKEKVKIIQTQLTMIQFIQQRLKQMKQAKRILHQKEFKQNLFKKQLKGYWKILQNSLITF